MRNHFSLRIITPDGIIFENDTVSALHLRSSLGGLTLLAHHAPLLTMVVSEKIALELGDGPERLEYQIAGGTLEFSENQCTLLTSHAQLFKDH